MNIEDLISQYIDGSLSSEAEAELHHRLAVSPEARRLFRAHIMLKGVARDQRVLHVPTPAMRAGLFERLSRDEGMKLPESASVQEAAGDLPARGSVQSGAPVGSSPAAAPPRSIPSSTLRGNTSRRRRRMLPWLIPIVMAGLMIGILWNAGDEEPNNAGTIAGRKVEDLPPAPGAGGADMVNPSSPQAGLATDAAPLSDRDAAAPTASGAGAANDLAGSVSRADVDEPSAEEKPASSTFDQPPALSSTQGGSGTTNRVELSAERPTYEQNRSIGATRSSPSRRSTARDSDLSFEGEGDNGQVLRNRHRGPDLPMKDGLASSLQSSGSEANEEDASREPLRAKEDQEGAPELQFPSELPKSTLAASAPPSASAVDSSRALGYSSIVRPEQLSVDNERYGSSAQKKSPSSPTMAYADESNADDAPKMANSAARKQDASGPETMMVAEAQEKKADPPVLSSNGVDASSRKGAPTSVPSDRMLAAAPPPAPPMGAYDSSSQAESKIRDGSKSKAAAMSSSSSLDESPSPIRYVAGLEQRSMIDLDASTVTLQVIARGGVELNEVHQIYLLVGGSSHSQSGVDLFGGGGYRYMLILAGDWNVALGGWAGAGKRYVRTGVEIPVAYRINRLIRIELIPTLQYSRRTDGAGTPAEAENVSPGIGIGASMSW